MKYSGIGGQAVLEGVMMKNHASYAVAVRKPDHEIAVVKKEYHGLLNQKTSKIPMLRGILSFIDSLVLGISTLMVSSAYFAEEDEEDEEEKKTGRRRQKRARSEHEQQKQQREAGADADGVEFSGRDKAMMGTMTVVSFVIALVVFMLLPYYLSQVFNRIIPSETIVTIIEGVLRLAIFIGYILLISRMPDIQRTFRYHGAEHKCINCIEHGLDLNVENVRKSSKEHKRCGTSFLMFVIIISIILFLFIRTDSHLMRVVFRLLLVPVIAGISFELLRAAGMSDNRFVNLLSRPGLWMQGLTTKEPDDEMIEVGIASVEAVFDWRPYVQLIREEEKQKE